ncbi:MAG: hypothetical protein KC503_15110 [Myxococcales bacterium]|nr:hypothetical protein [Myxococcales bacterium]
MRHVDRLLLLACLIAGCAGSSSKTKTPKAAPAAKPAKRASPLLGLVTSAGSDSALASALAKKIAEKIGKLEVAVSQKKGDYWLVALVAVKKGPGEKKKKRNKGDGDGDGDVEIDHTCECRYESLVAKGRAHVVALRKAGSSWRVIGHHVEDDVGVEKCKAQVQATFGDRNANGKPDVVLTFSAVDEGCPAVGEHWERSSSLWELADGGLVKQLDLGSMQGMSTRAGGGDDFAIVETEQGKPSEIYVASASDQVSLEQCAGAAGDYSDLDEDKRSACKEMMKSAKRYVWSASAKAWKLAKRVPPAKPTNKK